VTVSGRAAFYAAHKTVGRLRGVIPGEPLLTQKETDVNDLHIWESGSEQKLLSAHLVSGEESPDHEAIIRAVQELLLHKYGISHTTLQILPFSAGEMEHCNHCN
jgi:cobalt-zinc-cadmium efflux system protein